MAKQNDCGLRLLSAAMPRRVLRTPRKPARSFPSFEAEGRMGDLSRKQRTLRDNAHLTLTHKAAGTLLDLIDKSDLMSRQRRDQNRDCRPRP
jgi:hypothetical protein